MASLSEMYSCSTIVAGKFTSLHDGHRELLRTAFEQEESLIVGLTRYIPSFRAYRVVLRGELSYLSRKEEEYSLIKISDEIQLITELENIDILVVTPKDDIRKRAKKINQLRGENSLPELSIVESDVVNSGDGEPISSTRIIDREIDEHEDLLDDNAR